MKPPVLKDQKERDFITGENKKGLSHNLFVRAGAGAGKTYSIQHRVKNLFLHQNLKPEHMAVITYTTKAAAELKDRIRSIMEATASEDKDKKTREVALGVLDELSKAKISTVHSFCLDLLREYPVEFNVDPESEIADDRQSAAFANIVQREFLQKYGSPQANFPGSIADAAVFRIFQVLYANRELKPKKLSLQSGEAARKRIIDAANRTAIDLLETIFVTIESEIKNTEDKLYQKIDKIRHFFARFGVTKDDRSHLSDAVQAILKGQDSPFPSAGAQGSYKSKEFLKNYKARASEFKTIIEQYQLSALTDCYNVLIEAFPKYRELYDDLKRKAGFLDFADCLLLMRNSLRDNEALRNSLQERFHHIIVDEFQDSDPLQSQILFYLAAEAYNPKKIWKEQAPTPGMLLFVGDPKQSIYGFNRADIAIYLEVMQQIIKQDKEADKTLSTNFRSKSEIVDFINKYFSQIIKTHATEPFASPPYEAMTAKDAETGNDQRIKIIEINPTLSTDAPGMDEVKKDGQPTTQAERSREAWCIAKFIQDEITKNKKEPGDFLILFRKTAGMEAYEKELERLNIPVLNTKTLSFLQLREAYPLIALIGLILQPDSTYHLYALLRSQLIGLSDESLSPFFKKGQKDKPTLTTMAKAFPELKTLETAIANGFGIIDKYENACRALELYCSSFGKEREELVGAALKLKEIVREELLIHDFNPKKVLQSLMGGALKSQESFFDTPELEEERLLLETEHPTKVRLMTVHGAKGLESKIVILANPGTGHIKKTSLFVDREKDEIAPVNEKIFQTSIAEHPELQTLAARDAIFKSEEENRILYVAATRPIEMLYIVKYTEREAGAFLNPLSSLLPADFPKIELEVTEEYRTRFRVKPKSITPSSKALKRDEYEAKQRTACEKLNMRSQTSEAVTASLRDEAENVFKDNLDGRDRGKDFGNLTHQVFEAVCLRAGEKMKTSEEEMGRIVEKLNRDQFGFESKEVEEIKGNLKKFLGSKIYAAICAADRVLAEVPFKLSGKVHGVIDLMYEDAAGVHLIDWKSDTFSDAGRAARVKEFYKKQMSAYVGAIEGLMKCKVASAECVYVGE